MFLCTDFPPYTSHSMFMLLCLLGHQSCGRSFWLHHFYYCQHFICKYYVYITPTPLPLLQVLLCTLPKFIIYFFYCFQYICIYMYIYTCMPNLLTSLSFDPMFMCQGLTTWDGKPLWEAAPRANWLFLFQQLLTCCNSSSRGRTLWNFPYFVMSACGVMLAWFRQPYCWKFMGIYFVLCLGCTIYLQVFSASAS